MKKLRLSQYCILKTVEELGPISVRDLIDITGHSNSSCIFNLHRKGFIIDIGGTIRTLQLAPGFIPDDHLNASGRIMKYFHDNPGKTTHDVVIALDISKDLPSGLAFQDKLLVLLADPTKTVFQYRCNPEFCVWCE